MLFESQIFIHSLAAEFVSSKNPLVLFVETQFSIGTMEEMKKEKGPLQADKKEKDKKEKNKKHRFPIADFVSSKKEEDKEKEDDKSSEGDKSRSSQTPSHQQTQLNAFSNDDRIGPMSESEAARHQIRILCDSISEAEAASLQERQKAWLESLESRGLVMSLPEAIRKGLLPNDYQPST